MRLHPLGFVWSQRQSSLPLALFMSACNSRGNAYSLTPLNSVVESVRYLVNTIK
jgi:hypothetical protein